MTGRRGLLLLVELEQGETRLLCFNVDISNVPNTIWKGTLKKGDIKNYGVDYSLIEAYLSENDKKSIKQAIEEIKRGGVNE